jgi:hypothetical protein
VFECLLRNFKKSQLFIEFIFIWYSDLKSVAQNYFYAKYSLFGPFYSTTHGGHTTPPPAPLPTVILLKGDR